MHMDYGNNMFMHPLDWDEIDNVAVIVYLSDTKKLKDKLCFSNDNVKLRKVEGLLDRFKNHHKYVKQQRFHEKSTF